MKLFENIESRIAREDAESLRDAIRDPDLALATRWIAGELSHEEAAQAGDRYDRDPAFRDIVDPLCIGWKLPGRLSEQPTRSDAIESAWHRFRENTGLLRGEDAAAAMEAIYLRHVREKRRAARMRLALRWAFVLPLLVFPTAVTANFLKFMPFFVERHHTGSNETSTIVFPDGSRAILAPSTKLRYDEYKYVLDSDRLIYLEGEATFFVIPKKNDPKNRFIVRTRSAYVVAVGTVFTVHSYRGEPTTDVRVTAGSVRVSPEDRGERIVLGPGQSARVNGVTDK
jgi:ferric-dicitrate binding protein FerR (iron transport regulator)